MGSRNPALIRQIFENFAGAQSRGPQKRRVPLAGDREFGTSDPQNIRRRTAANRGSFLAREIGPFGTQATGPGRGGLLFGS